MLKFLIYFCLLIINPADQEIVNADQNVDVINQEIVDESDISTESEEPIPQLIDCIKTLAGNQLTQIQLQDFITVLDVYAADKNLSAKKLLMLALTESDFRVRARNSNPNSVDRGLFQHNSIYWNTRKNAAIRDFEKYNLDVHYENTSYDPILGLIVAIWLTDYNTRTYHLTGDNRYLAHIGVGYVQRRTRHYYNYRKRFYRKEAELERRCEYY